MSMPPISVPLSEHPQRHYTPACTKPPAATPATILVSVIIPVYNEEKSVGRCLDSVAATSFPHDALEVLVVDGGSSDRSRDLVRERASQFRSLRLLNNPKRLQAAAMNIGIQNSRGAYIIRMDAHSEYPPDYIAASVAELQRTGACNVGGTWIVRPGANTRLARGIAACVQHAFGVGNAAYRLGGSGYVDTVPFGAFRRELFDRIGGYREGLGTHEDYELNARIRRAGGKVYLSPLLYSVYHHVSSLGGFLQKSWNYGYWCSRWWLVYPYSFCWRQCVPLLFVLSLLASSILILLKKAAAIVAVTILGSYAALAIASALQLGLRIGWAMVPILPPLFFLRHVVYGAGTFAGMVHHFLRRDRAVAPGVAQPLS